jgi:hypothetical protein
MAQLVGTLIAAAVPQAEITNGGVRATLYLPDAENGYYRATRFDWSGIIASLTFRGHTYFGKWFEKYDPTYHDAIMGPVEEFISEDAWAATKPGDPFMKIGVGFIRKPSDAPYMFSKTYDIVNPGKWTVKPGPDRVEFTQELSDEASGYAYLYKKTVRLANDKPDLILEHTLRNTGQKPIETSVYDHNFFVIDDQPPGPDFSIRFPFTLKAIHPELKDIAELRGGVVAFIRAMKGTETVYTHLTGFSDDVSDYNIRVENSKTAAGVRVTADRPLSALVFWASSTTLCPEAYVKMSIDPGEEFKWQITYHFYTLPVPGSE